MGANYDMLIVSAGDADAVRAQIEQYLSGRGFALGFVRQLERFDIHNDNAILLSPPSNGWIEVVACNSALGISGTAWFGDSPFARHLSIRHKVCIHVWSFDSGFVVGYMVYTGGEKREGTTVFTKHAKSADELMPGILAPAAQRGHRIGEFVGQGTYDFQSEVAVREDRLEVAIAELVSRLGLRVHLVDYYSATDEREGICVTQGQYTVVDLAGWTAVSFSSDR